MESLPTSLKVILYIAPIVLIAGWLIILRIESRSRNWSEISLSEAEQQNVWRKSLGVRVCAPVFPIAYVALAFWIFPYADIPLYFRIVLSGTIIVMTLFHIHRTARLVSMDWEEARKTGEAQRVFDQARKKQTYTEDQVFGENGAVLKK